MAVMSASLQNAGKGYTRKKSSLARSQNMPVDMELKNFWIVLNGMRKQESYIIARELWVIMMI